ncbi:MAG: LysE family translocator [Pseudomonadota bacterium]
MDITTLGAFVAASMLLLAIPGPTVLLIVAYAISQGRRVALSIAAGVALGDLVAMTASLAGIGALLMTSATLFTLLKWIGAAYLLWLGISLWRAGGSVLAQAEPEPVAAGTVFRRAFVVTALNPKSIAFFVAFVPQFIDPGAAYAPQAAVLVSIFVGLAALNAFGFALLADHAGSRIRRPSVRRWISRVGGSALVAMAAATAATRSA